MRAVYCKRYSQCVLCTVKGTVSACCGSQITYRFRVIKNKVDALFSSVYFVNQLIHVSGIFVAHRQEVYCIYIYIHIRSIYIIYTYIHIYSWYVLC